jgi:predicted AAA+ superfamily ATPase
LTPNCRKAHSCLPEQVLAQALIEPRVREALADTPVALVIGPKRARKTTLVRAMGELAQDYLTTAF